MMTLSMVSVCVCVDVGECRRGVVSVGGVDGVSVVSVDGVDGV